MPTLCKVHLCVLLISYWLPFPAMGGDNSEPYAVSFEDFQWQEPAELVVLPASKPLGEPIDLAAAINLLQERVLDRPKDVVSCTILGELFLRKAKEQDDLPSYAASVEQLRYSLSLNPSYVPAKRALASSLMAVHRFEEALVLATQLDRERPSQPATLATLFDCQLELGNYAAAHELLGRLIVLERTAPVLARAARLKELGGDAGSAIALLEEAVSETSEESPIYAWLRWRMGCINFAAGRSNDALKDFKQSLDSQPHYEPANVGLAKVLFLEGDGKQALSILEDIALSEAPPVVALLGDVLAALGHTQRAEAVWQHAEELMEEESHIAQAAHAREYAMFLADHRRRPELALELANIDLAQRADPFAWDAKAWVLYRMGRYDDASGAIEHALASVKGD
ncbi:MAG: tetratricopeptide repeat protein, partial [Planctomycetales bacterium]|nr:tetratricopeptide repeat protein [Planctomycetales bacterium]